MTRALISVYDKSGLTKFASGLVELGWTLIASGGTCQTLKDAGLEAIPVETLTGAPEMLGGRVKTLHPAIHAGILARDTQSDRDDLAANHYDRIDLVVCNLYPFQQVITEAATTLQDALENIDIGGVTLLRAAAKNFFHVTVVSDPEDYTKVLAALRGSNETDLALRRSLALKAFAHTRDYDTAIHAFLARGTMTIPVATDELPQQLSLSMQKVETLRYGENAHQQAAFYGHQAGSGPLGSKELSNGKQLSYNNILDLDAAWRATSSYSDPTVVIVKHLTPIGIASGTSLAEAFPKALASDPVSAFGGVIAVNRSIDMAFVEALGSLFIEAIAAPAFSADALATLIEKRKNCRLLQIPHRYDGADLEIRSVHRGLLVQRADTGDPEGMTLKTVSARAPTTEELAALHYAWKAVQHVKSNAIVLALRDATVGIGGGLPSRVDAVKLAVEKAGENAAGSVLASDAFFPFPDGVEVAARAGVTAVIQPGGSIRDSEVIEAVNKAGMAMVFTGTRHFRH
jgi:phosphoribosylaminoimidazolecarboxamide formyltransferase/IMP cyclohydrolase